MTRPTIIAGDLIQDVHGFLLVTSSEMPNAPPWYGFSVQVLDMQRSNYFCLHFEEDNSFKVYRDGMVIYVSTENASKFML